MSQLLIQHYLNDLQTLRRASGTSRESVVREAFKTLLKDWGRSRDLIFLPEHHFETLTKSTVRPDGTLVYGLRVPFGYWEAKDTDDNLDQEIEKKFRKGYPQDNIIFEDSHEAVLIQNKLHVMRCGVEDPTKLQQLLDLFFSYEREEIADFRKAVEKFKIDLPQVLKALRDMIERAEADNDKFRKAALKFLKHAQDTINPSVTAADVREMLIQHILTEEIFSQVFDNADFHRQNNVAKELYALENTFFIGKVKHDTLAGLRPYYAAIKSAAALVTGHHEKQNFLKTIYENFYKVYNKKAADRLGVVYTPNEIVRFMIESTDWLCAKHFQKSLIDKNVEILDPATGTGTFITELIEHFRGQPTKLRYKYLEELHANEVAILPYYVANLNIEATYAAINGYEEYPNLCFVDTLDNTAALRAAKGGQEDLFGGVSAENVARIKRQNKKKISVIIGNPPYNANQLNENDNNKNREYREIDRRIKATYVAASTAQKTKLYDPYARFFRWASDRIELNGVIAFVSNSSFIDSRTYDGFRKAVAEDFNEIWIVDLKGNARTTGERRRREGGNVFEDQIRVGVAVYFCVKKAGSHGCQIRYEAVGDYVKSDDKRSFLAATPIGQRSFEIVKPDQDYNWIDITKTDFHELLPIGNKETKNARIETEEQAIFSLFSLGISTNRDDWAYGEEPGQVLKKIKFFREVFLAERNRWIKSGRPKPLANFVDRTIKWTAELESHLERGSSIKLDEKHIFLAQYRPFVRKFTYFAPIITHRTYQNDRFFTLSDRDNVIISISRSKRSAFSVVATNCVASADMFTPDVGQCFGRFRIAADGSRIDNITDWALDQFRVHYGAEKRAPRKLTKDAIFHYVYGVLHDPTYREKYAQNMKRAFPRIPFYAEFWKWAAWGEKLMALHIGYETIEPWKLERIDAVDEGSHKAGVTPKVLLKADKENGNIQLDSETQLIGVPAEAWTYRLGNRSALEWILDQYKERTPKDPTIRKKFNTYRFGGHKEKVINLLMRVTRVSIETMAIVEAMKEEK
jgi:predicted helicase